MAINTAVLTAVSAATTAAVGATNKVTALTVGLVDACLIEVAKNSIVTPGQQKHIAALRADVAANIAALQTAVGL